MQRRGDSTKIQNSGLYITRIRVDELFGRYSYDLDCSPASADTSQLLLLYGENGTGKTTILSMIYHLLSKEVGKGHRSSLAKCRFKQLCVSLSDGTNLLAKRVGGDVIGSFQMTLGTGSEEHTFLFKTDKDGDVSITADDPEFVKFTRRLPDISLYFLPDDRKMTTDIELEGREVNTDIAGIRHVWRSGQAETRIVSKTETVLSKVVEWLREQALAGSTAGQLNVNSIYSDIVAGLVTPTTATRVSLGADELVSVLRRQAARNREYSKYGLTSELAVDDLISSILRTRNKKARINVIAQVLRPYIDGNEARLKALDAVQKAAQTFVESINTFYTDKKVVFNLREGIQIFSKDDEALSPQVLSSGEKQLLILFCNVIMTGSNPTIFIIDEPELSLNIKWQRQLVDSLLACVKGRPVQFLLATHSLELLAKHRRNVVRLGSPDISVRPSEPLLFREV